MKTWLVALSLLLLTACGDGRNSSGGNTTETGNSLHAVLRLPNGQPAAMAQYVLRLEEGADPVLSSGHADGQGNIQVEIPADSGWILEAASQDGSHLGIMASKADSMVLTLPAQLRGQLYGHDIQGLVIHLAGLGRDIPCDTSGKFFLDSLPAGSLTLEVRRQMESTPAIHAENIQTEANRERNLGLLPISAADSLLQTLELRIPGGMLDSTVTAYPLLAKPENFTHDSLTVIFQGRALAWERDGTALWIRIDSLTANSQPDTVRLALLWGMGSPRAVFRPEDGWRSVLHLENTQAVIGPDLEYAPLAGTGIAGAGARFDQAEIPLLDSVAPLQALYISGWIRPEQNPGTGHIPWVAESQGNTWTLYGNGTGGWTWRVQQESAAEAAAPAAAEVGVWKYLAMWVEPASQTIGISQNGSAPVIQSALGTLNTAIRPSLGYGFSGDLDEFRIRNRVPTQAERRLDTWIQQPGSPAVVIQKR